MKAALTPNWKSGLPGFASMTIFALVTAHAAWLIPANFKRSQPLDAVAAFGFEMLFAVPAFLYVIGFSRMRYVVAVQCFLLLPLWLFLPVAQHAIDRTPLFWGAWSLSLTGILFSAVASLAPQTKK